MRGENALLQINAVPKRHRHGTSEPKFRRYFAAEHPSENNMNLQQGLPLSLPVWSLGHLKALTDALG